MLCCVLQVSAVYNIDSRYVNFIRIWLICGQCTGTAIAEEDHIEIVERNSCFHEKTLSDWMRLPAADSLRLQ